MRDNPEPHTPRQRAQYHQLFARQIDEKPDVGTSSYVFKQAEAPKIVRDALYYFDGERSFLNDWATVPRHLHRALTLRDGFDHSWILHSIKSSSAKSINSTLGRSGNLWQEESFAHIVRSATSSGKLRHYLADNSRGLAKSEFH